MSRQTGFSLSPQIIFLLTFAGVILLGWGLLSLPVMHSAQASGATWLDHLFTATSGVSTTGLCTLSFAEDYSRWGQFVVLILFQLGGLGYVAFAGAAGLSGGQIDGSLKKAVTAGSYLPENLELRFFLRITLAFTFVVEALGSIVLSTAFMQQGLHWQEALWQGVYHSISAFCTAGFGLHPDSLQAYSDAPEILVPVILLMLTGSLGFMVVAALYEWLTGRARRFDHMTKAVCTLFAILFIATAVLAYSTSSTIGGTAYPVIHAVFLSATSLTGAGFASVNTGALSLGVLCAIMLPMCAGGAPSGTSGGIKLSNLAVNFAALWAQVRDLKEPHIDGVTLPGSQQRQAASVVFLFALLLLLGLVWMLFLESGNHPFQAIAFEAVSAFGTVGLSRGITGELLDSTKGLMIALMFVGRVGVLTLILGLLRTGADVK